MASIHAATETDSTIIFVHGRGWKPDSGVLHDLWTRALRSGLERDHAEVAAAQKFDQATLRTVYYGDLTNAARRSRGATYDEALDVADLHNALQSLQSFDSVKRFRRTVYESQPRHSPAKEFLADVGAPVLSWLGLTTPVLRRLMPEVAAYLHDEPEMAEECRTRMTAEVRSALARGDRVMILSHCLGSVIAYDVLWQLSWSEATQAKKIHTWITIGSPLGDEFVKRRLKGGAEAGERRFPANIVNWYNVSAEDDFTCHDQAITDDFAAMLDKRLLSRMVDYHIYNPAVRFGRSNPHNSLGYLIHPRIARLVAEWLNGA